MVALGLDLFLLQCWSTLHFPQGAAPPLSGVPVHYRQGLERIATLQAGLFRKTPAGSSFVQ